MDLEKLILSVNPKDQILTLNLDIACIYIIDKLEPNVYFPNEYILDRLQDFRWKLSYELENTVENILNHWFYEGRLLRMGELYCYYLIKEIDDSARIKLRKSLF